MAKTRIFGVQAVLFGCLGAFSLLSGPTYLLGLMKKANGGPATDAGIGLTLMSLPFLLVFALALYNLRSLRRPLLRLCREGIEVVLIGTSSLDHIPLIPVMIRVAWLILATQGFRQKIVCVPWRSFHDAWVSGAPMSRQLTIVATRSIPTADGLPHGAQVADQIVMKDAMFSTPLEQIAAAIKANAVAPDSLGRLPSWHEPAGPPG